MEELQTCRVCLATDVKLFSMYKCNLIAAFEALIGSQISSTDGLPQLLCSFCCALLLKCASFQQRCRRSQQLLSYAVIHELLTTDYIHNIDRETHNLTLPYCVQYDPTNKYETRIQHDTTIKEEIIYNHDSPIQNTEEYHMQNSVQFQDTNITSDEEPLAKKVKKKRKKKHKTEEKIKKEIDPGFTDDFDNIDQSYDNNKQDLDLNKLEKDLDFEFRDDIEVVTLTKEQQIEEVQARRNSHNYLNSMCKCDICFKGFMSDATYRNHMIRHDPSSGAHACEICGTRWACARSLRAHAVTSHERHYVCKRCRHVSKSSHRAKEHSKWHEGYMYVCDICGASFSKSTSHLTHLRLQHPSGHTCDLCGESFIGQYGLNMHRKKAHRSIENTQVKSESQCVLCSVRFRSIEALENHVNTSKDNICDPSLRSCVICGTNYETEELLSEHMKEHQNDHSVKCVECGRQFANARTHAVHYQHFHLPQRRAGSRSKRSYRDVQSVVCELCGKTCMSKATLIYHQRTHTGEKPYQCSECPKRFSILQRLQIHLRTHTGERPFKCSHCPKAFKQKAALNRHDRVHSGARPYACAHCGKAFSQSNSMKTHVRTVHLKLPAPYRNNKKKE